MSEFIKLRKLRRFDQKKKMTKTELGLNLITLSKTMQRLPMVVTKSFQNEFKDLERLLLLDFYYTYVNANYNYFPLGLLKYQVAKIEIWSQEGFFSAKRLLRVLALFELLGGKRKFVLSFQMEYFLYVIFAHRIRDGFYSEFDAICRIVDKLRNNLLLKAKNRKASKKYDICLIAYE